MDLSLQLGPLVLPAPLLLVLACTALAVWLARRLGRRAGVDAEPPLWRVLLAAVLAARIGFVWSYREAYLAAPLAMLDIRDGGWSPVAGIVGAWIAATAMLPRGRPARRPVLAALATATSVWLLGSLALQWHGLQQQRTLPALQLVAVDGGTVDL